MPSKRSNPPPLPSAQILIPHCRSLDDLIHRLSTFSKSQPPKTLLPVYLLRQRTSLTIQVSELLAVIDLNQLPLTKLAPLHTFFIHSSNLLIITPTAAAVASIFHPYVKAALSPKLADSSLQIADIQLGHEILDGTLFAPIHTTARAVGAGMPAATVIPHVLNEKTKLAAFSERAQAQRFVYERLAKRIISKSDVWYGASMNQVRRLAQNSLTKSNAPTVVGFHCDTYRLNTNALLSALGKTLETKVEVFDEAMEMDLLLNCLPIAWADQIRLESGVLVDVSLDLGRPPLAYFREGKKLRLGRGEVVVDEDLRGIESKVEEEGEGIGEDNRGGLVGGLHRVSVLRGRMTGDIVGVTLRVGRHLWGVAAVLTDILLHKEHEKKSILLLGPPGSGKTTMSRDIARMLSERKRVMIVDSSDEIGGPGLVPHASIGDARRMSVQGGKNQLVHALIEAVENHTPDVLVADELSDRDEVNGASTAMMRGVRLVSSAHGCLRSLLKNLMLKGLLGGTERVTMSDRFTGGDVKDKLKTMRSAEPIFRIVVEMGVMENDPTACRVIRDAGSATDALLQGSQYECELRRRGPDGDILVSRITA